MVNPVKAVTSVIDKVAEAAAKAAQEAFEAATRKAPPVQQPPVVQPPTVTAPTVVPANSNAQPLNFSGASPILADIGAGRRQQPTLPQEPTPPETPPGDPKLDNVVKGMAEGKSLEIASKDAGFKNGDEGYKAFGSNQQYKAKQEKPTGDTRVTTITDPGGRTVTENYNFKTKEYTTEVTEPGGKTVKNPTRDEAGWKVTRNVDAKTGAETTRRENDLGGGEVKETTKLKNGVAVQVDTDAKGESRTEVTSPNGAKTRIAGKFDPTTVDTKAVLDGARKNGTGLSTKEIAGFQAAGYDVTTTPAASESGTSRTTIGDPKSGQTLLTAETNHRSGDQSVSFVDGKGAEVTRTLKSDGKVVERTVNTHGTEYVRTTDGDKTTLTIDGENVDPAKTLDNGTARITMPDGSAGVILPTGEKVALGANQDGSGDYGAFIQEGLENGKSIDLLSKRLGWTREQTVAELYLNGADDVTLKEGTPKDFGLEDLGLPKDAKVTLTTVTRDGIKLSSLTRPIGDGKPFQIEVAKGDDLWTIAEKHGLTVDQLLANKDNAKLVGEDPNHIEIGGRLTIEGGTKTTVAFTFSKDDIAVAGPTLAPVSDGGEVTLQGRAGDTPASIAADYPWMTAKDVLAANPHLKDGKIKGGETIVIPDSTRLAAIKGQTQARGDLDEADLRALTTEGADYDAQTPDGELVAPGAVKLVTGMTDEMLYATRRSAIPGDALAGLSSEMKARRPGDKAWAAAVDLAAKEAQSTFATQGRTEAVMGPLYDLARAGDPTKFKDHVKKVYGAVAATEPTAAAIEQAKQSLMTYGPQDAGPQLWVEGATQDFLVNDPKAKAAEVQKAYDGGGDDSPVSKASAGAKKLAELTDPKTTDPLTAALVLKAAQPTVDKIVGDLGPYDNEKIFSLYASDVSFVKEEGQAASNAYADLSAAAESAARSPEGQPAIERLGGQLKDRNLVSNTGYSLLNQGGVSLSLEIAKQRRAAGDADGAAMVENGVLKAIDAAEKHTLDLGDQLGLAAAPMILPEEDWKPFLEDGKLPENWFNDQEALDKISSLSGQIDDSSRWLALAYQGVDRYAPSLKGSPSEAALFDKADPTKMDPRLLNLFGTSPGAAVENLRQVNQTGLSGGALERPNIIPEWSWPARVVRNASINFVDAKNLPRPQGVGLALFGLGTYVVGSNNKIQEGGSSYVTAGLYVAGGLTEAWSALGQFTDNKFGWRTADAKWWQRAVAAGGDMSNPAFKVANNAPLRALGWWNAYNAVASFNQGEIVPGILHTAAAGGITASTGPFKGGNNALNSRLAAMGEKGLGAVKWIKFGGNVVTLLASSGLALYDMHEKRKPIENLSDKHTQFLTAAGVKPEVAEALGIMPGEDGISAAPRLAALAEYRGISPQELLDYLNGKKPRDSFDLAYAAGYVEPGADGKMPIGQPSADWNYTPPNKADFRPKTIAELNQFVERYMPDFPGKTP